MPKAIVVHQTGGTDALNWEEVDVGTPGEGEIRVRNTAVGVNFIDVYQRTGLYKLPLPFVAGNEGAGEVVAVGAGVSEFAVGDRVAYAGPTGAYAEERLLPASKAVPIPDDVSDEVAAAALLKGTTAFYLLHWTHALKAGETVLIHAAAGGTGQILTQWAKAIGATVIGTAGGPEKVAIVEGNGADLAIDYKAEDFVEKVKAFTDGRGVDVVYDGVGQATFLPSLDCLRPRGLMVSFGNASGAVSIDKLTVLAEKGSLFLTRPTSASYFTDAATLREGAKALFEVIASGKVKIAIDRTLPLAEAAEAHRALEARETTGSTVLKA
ncbi:quinone oxidoreductase family protein [Devosia sp.]|uniref:quinone oxidoreductase family protein n=1 Tax=Devosia sp. TaxID=1871048 RepID=UPI003A8FB41D